MEKEFIPYTEALELKELGFDEPCLAFYNKESKLIITGISKLRYTPKLWSPTFSQSFRWFREKYGVECFIKHFKPNAGYPDGYYCISNPNKYYSDSTSDWCFTNFKNYEEAELECLKKLIEIVKEN